MGAADSFFTKAELAIKKRNYDYAIELFLQGLEIDPDRLEERKKLRATAVRRVQEAGGNTMGGGAFKLKRLGALGKVKKLGMTKDFEKQILELEKILRDAPQNVDLNMDLANAFIQSGRLESAIWGYTCVLEVAPTNVEALKHLGRLYEKQTDFERAIQCWERVRQADPSDQEAGKAVRDLAASTMMKRADARRQSGGDGSFRDLLKDSDESGKLEQKQKIIRTSDDAMAAIELKAEEVARTPGNTRLMRELGDLYVKAKKFDEARTVYQQALQVDPQDMYTQERLGTLEERQIQAGIEDLRTAMVNSPDDAEIKRRVAEAEKKYNDFMLTELPRRVAAHPTDYSLKASLGRLYQKNSRFDEAIQQYQQSGKDPKFAIESNYRIGQCFFAKKLYDLAIKQYNTALGGVSEADSPLAKNLRYDLATAHLGKGERDKALEYFEEVMSVDIGFRDVSRKVDEIRGS
ncbi:MAG: tetratricopeptide repeat protein [Planctomycetota bacterium]